MAQTDSGGLQPWLTVSVEGANGELRQYEVILDTGFTGCLVLPEPVIKELGLVKRGSEEVVLASSQEYPFNYYAARVLWRGQPRWTDIYQSEAQALLGMELLESGQIAVDARDGGDVTVTFAQAVPEAPA